MDHCPVLVDGNEGIAGICGTSDKEGIDGNGGKYAAIGVPDFVGSVGTSEGGDGIEGSGGTGGGGSVDTGWSVCGGCGICGGKMAGGTGGIAGEPIGGNTGGTGGGTCQSELLFGLTCAFAWSMQAANSPNNKRIANFFML
ncbi:MAG: hypothetical protein ACTHNW_13070 [Mucilaginibacter sp.]